MPGVPTSPNVLSAFLQGLKDVPGDQLLPITVYRCTACGHKFELFQSIKASGTSSTAPLRESFGNWSNLKIVLLVLDVSRGRATGTAGVAGRRS